MKVLVIGQQKQSKLSGISFELIGAARSIGADIQTVILAADASPLAEELANHGGGQVLAVSHPKLEAFNDEIYVRVIGNLIEKHKPDLVMAGATFYGKALMPRLAAKNGGKMVSDVNALSVDNDRVVVSHPCFGGNVSASCSAADGPGALFITVRPKIFAESTEGAGEVVIESVPDGCFEAETNITEVKVEASGAVSLSEADVIVSAGRGIRGPENVPLIEALARSMKAAFGASRAIVDAGWVPYANQVGQTGRTVNPKLYVAVGISGAIQHLVGMQTSKTIVAINKDKDAPIFAVANYGIVGDLFEVVPALTARFEKELG